MRRRTLGFAILRKSTIFLQYFGILGGIKYYLLSLPLFSEPFPLSDSFGNKLNSKITQLKLGSL